MSIDDLKTRLTELNEDTLDNANVEQLKDKLKSVERTRNWLIWHGHSTIANSGFMLFLLRELYDQAIHISNKQYLDKYGTNIDVQIKN